MEVKDVVLRDEARHACREIADRLGFAFFHLLLRGSVDGLPMRLSVDDAPPSLARGYERHLDLPCSPLHGPDARTLPYSLHDWLRANQMLLTQFAEHGVVDGVAVPLRGPRRMRGLLTLLDSNPVAVTMHTRQQLFSAAHWLGHCMVEQLVRRRAFLG